MSVVQVWMNVGIFTEYGYYEALHRMRHTARSPNSHLLLNLDPMCGGEISITVRYICIHTTNPHI